MDSRSTIVRDSLIPSNGGCGIPLIRGQRLRIIDTGGQRAPHLICLSRTSVGDRSSMATTRLMSGRWNLTPGMTLYSFHVDPMLTVLADTVGRHHLEGGYCTEPGNLARLGEAGRGANCYDNFVGTLAELGIGAEHVQPDMCAALFLRYTDDPDGRRTCAVASTRGDHIEFEAEVDLLVAISDCPHPEVGIARARRSAPVRIVVTQSR